MSNTALFLWLLLFALVSIVVARSTQGRWQQVLLAACGLAFVATVSPLSALWMAGFGVAFGVLRHWPALRPAGTPTAVVLIVVAYLYHLWRSTHVAGSEASAEERLVPLGMAFYVLRLIHYGVELHANRLPEHSTGEYAAWLFFCPIVPVGPIYRFDAFLKDLRRQRWDTNQFLAGAQTLLYAAATFFLLGNWLYGQWLQPRLATWVAAGGWQSAYGTALQLWIPLYLYFKAYADVARGAGTMCGIEVPHNFVHPFGSRNIVEFWTRWHITLGQWCRQYVFLPVMAQWRSASVAVACSMVVLGLWHELSLRYLLWGVYHSAGILLVQALSRRSQPQGPTLDRVLRPLSILLTVHFVIFSFTITSVVEHSILSFVDSLMRYVQAT